MADDDRSALINALLGSVDPRRSALRIAAETTQPIERNAQNAGPYRGPALGPIQNPLSFGEPIANRLPYGALDVLLGIMPLPGAKLYRGTAAPGQRGPGGHRYLTDDPQIAEFHATGPEGAVYRYSVAPDLRGADLTASQRPPELNALLSEIAARRGWTPDQLLRRTDENTYRGANDTKNQILDALKASGYDIAHMPDMNSWTGDPHPSTVALTDRAVVGPEAVRRLNEKDWRPLATQAPTQRSPTFVPAVSVEGSVYAKGPTHSDATMQWAEARRQQGLPPPSDADWAKVIDGYVDSNGRFLRRDQVGGLGGMREFD